MKLNTAVIRGSRPIRSRWGKCDNEVNGLKKGRWINKIHTLNITRTSNVGCPRFQSVGARTTRRVTERGEEEKTLPPTQTPVPHPSPNALNTHTSRPRTVKAYRCHRALCLPVDPANRTWSACGPHQYNPMSSRILLTPLSLTVRQSSSQLVSMPWETNQSAFDQTSMLHVLRLLWCEWVIGWCTVLSSQVSSFSIVCQIPALKRLRSFKTKKVSRCFIYNVCSCLCVNFLLIFVSVQLFHCLVCLLFFVCLLLIIRSCGNY